MSAYDDDACLNVPEFLAGGGEMGARMRSHAWASTPLGDPQGWPRALKTAIRLILNTGHPMYIWWGSDLICFYNDAYSRTLGPERHPGSLGQPGRDVWAEIWPLIGHQVDFVMSGQGSTWDENRQVPITRFGRLDEIYWTYSYSPIDDEEAPNGVGGVLVVCTETTEAVLAERRHAAETERQRRLFEQAPGFITILSSPDHTFEFVNAAYRRLFGDRDYIGKPAREVFPELADQDFFGLLDRVYSTGQRFVAEHIPISLEPAPGRPSEERFLNFIYEPMFNEDGSVSGIFVEGYDVTDRVHAERREALWRGIEERLRDLADPAQVVATTSEALGRHLRAGQVAYAEVEAGDETVLIQREWNDGSMASNARRHRMNSCGPQLIATLRNGETVAIPDVHLDPRITSPEVLATFAQASIRSLINVPLVKAGRLVAILAVHSSAPRTWSVEEIELTQDIAERTWAAAERARAEASLREAEERYLALFNALDQGFCTMEVKFDEHDHPIDYRFLEVSPSFERQTGIENGAGRWMREIAPDQDQHWFDIYGRVALTGEPARFVEHSTPLGRWWEVYAFRIAGPRRIAVLFHDITTQKRAEAALRESEARFRSMADRAPVMMWVTDQSGHCIHLNSRWYDFTGQQPGAGEGFGWLDAVHPDDRAAAEQAFLEANAEHRDYRVDFRLRRADGVYRWTIDAAAARISEAGEFLGYVGSVIDIDERREAEEKLALSEERLRLATDMAEIGQWDVDTATGAMFWPPRVKAMFGISPHVPVTLDDFYGGVHPDDRPTTLAAFEGAADPDRRLLYDVEYRTVGKEDGVIRWVAAKGRGLFTPDGVCYRVIGTAIDVTERKADEVRLHELNERLEQEVTARTAERNRVWEMSRDLFAIMGFDGRLKAINPAWESTLGRDTETLLALSFREQVHPDDHQAVQAVMQQLLGGETVERFEDRIRHADGSWRWISWTLVPEGDVFYAVGRDVTPEKEAAAELEHAQEALRQSQKMEAMGQLTGGVAHDFNNLLTPIVGGLDMLQRRGVGGEREQRLIAGAMQSADRAKTLVQRLLAFARRQPLQPTAVDVKGLVTGMGDLVASTTGPQIKVVVEAADDLPPAKADPNQLEMALLNLGVNARDAMPDGGTLRISANAEHIDTGHRSSLRPGEYICLSVADTGVGMDEATLKRAVEPFFSTKGVGKGTGLGLSMVHGLASQLGGALTIESKPGLGTNIQLWLPISEASAEVQRPAAAEPMPVAKGTALLVDDEELVRASTADMLGDIGYAVVEAGSAEEALRLLNEGLRAELLVTDHLMPGMTGADLAVIVRSSHPDTKVLIVSGYAENEGIDPDLPRLTKPFRNADLAAKLSQLAG